MAKVTEKQENFLKNLIYKNMSQREAYRKAYGNTTGTDKSIDERASRLMNSSKVAARYEELKCEKEGIEFFGLKKAEERFVECLVLGKSQRESYKTAYNCKNFKDKTIDEKASRLFHESKIQARYKQLMARIVLESEKETIMTTQEILAELSDTARSDITKVMDIQFGETGRVKLGLKKDFDPRNIKEMYTDKNGNLRIKMYDRISAMEKLERIRERAEARDREVEDKMIRIEIGKGLEGMGE